MTMVLCIVILHARFEDTAWRNCRDFRRRVEENPLDL